MTKQDKFNYASIPVFILTIILAFVWACIEETPPAL